MPNISIQKESAPRIVRDWEGSRLMRNLFGFDPFREMAPYAAQGFEEGELSPAFEVKETPEGFQFHADVPGIQEKDLNLTVNGTRLTISGKRERTERKQGETYFAYERSYGSFSRSFTLPTGADVQATKANLKDGVLDVFVPKKAAEQPKKIEVTKA
jgi:HSP20 family protein